MNEMVRITARDMVAVALKPLKAGETADYGGGSIVLTEDLPMGHKAALRDIRKGEPVIKYGFPIGEATEDIPAGAHVHTHNLRTLLSGEKEYAWHPTHPKQEKQEPAVFMGYPRAKGRPGIRNELWILPTVGCVNDVAKALAARAQALAGGGVEGVFAFTHPYGCSQLGEDQENTRRALATRTRAACYCWDWGARTAESRRSGPIWAISTKAGSGSWCARNAGTSWKPAWRCWRSWRRACGRRSGSPARRTGWWSA